MSSLKPPKRPKLRFDTVTGPRPNPNAKFRSASDFTKMYTAYQWTSGFDVKSAADGASSYRLTCATHPNCTFSIGAVFTTFGIDDGAAVAGKSGFRISPTNFRPSHDHSAPYLPLDVKAENSRLALLDPNDPAIDHPPLVPVGGGFAGASDASDDGDVKPRSHPRPRPVVPAHGFATSSVATPTPAPAPAPAPAPKAPSSTAGSATSAFLPGGLAPPMSPPEPAAFTFGGGGGGGGGGRGAVQPAFQYYQPQQQQQAPARALSTAPAPGASPAALTPLQQQQLATPLGQYLSQISPAFVAYLGDFAANDIPLSTTGQELVDLDSGHDDDRTVYDTIKDVRTLPPFLVTLVADGTRKAKLRQLAAAAGGGGGGGGVDPRISVGLKKAAAEKWVRQKMDEGRAVMAQRDGMAQARL
ncbi:hypothetical protein JCM9279_004833 [Rhodotorula babjevae]